MIPGPGRPRTACRTCKGQKIRCSGERPNCRRCVRLRHECIYEEASLQLRRVPKPRHPPAHAGAGQGSSGDDACLRAADSSASAVARNPLGEELYLGIPRSLVSTLVQVYFDNVYQSTLLLHRRRFLESLAEQTANPHVVLSICAWGANFFRDENGQPTLKSQGLMVEWAKRAGKLVFQEAEELHEENIVTFCNLSLFWHSQGSWRISHLHKGNAAQLLYITGLGSSQKLHVDDSLDSEIRRRRFWACYLLHCYGAERLSLFEPISDAQSLPLPWPDEDYDAELARCPPSSLTSDENDRGILGELIKGLTLWSSVVTSVKSADSTMSVRITDIHALHEEVTDWWRKTPSDIKLSSDNIAHVPNHALAKKLLVNIVYHQSLCAIHSSIVPLFCWGPGDDSWSSARQLSAQLAYEHACTISTLLQAAMATCSRLSAMPCFIAYAAYCSSAIQIPFMWSSSPRIKERAHANIRANIEWIHAMAEYWTLVSSLSVHVRSLYMVHKERSIILEDEPKYIDVKKLTSFRAISTHARSSILEFTGVLRSKHGYVQPGEETVDLGIQDQGQSDHPQSRTFASDRQEGRRASLRQDISSGPETHAPAPQPSQMQQRSQYPNQPSGDQMHSVPLFNESDQNQRPQELLQDPQSQFEQHSSILSPIPQTYAPTEGLPDLDVFNLFFDPEMTSLLPNGELLDSSQYDMDWFSLDFLDMDASTG